jgi:hypothetical protein
MNRRELLKCATAAMVGTATLKAITDPELTEDELNKSLQWAYDDTKTDVPCIRYDPAARVGEFGLAKFVK